MTGVIKVNSEVLKAQSTEVNGAINNLRNYFESIKSTVNNSRSYWEGEAAEVHRRMYADIESEVETILRRWQEHVTDLQQMAGVYEQVENAASEAAGSLPDNLLG